jgi:ABC-2 type transport system permease protein
MRRFFDVVAAVWWRSTHLYTHNPQFFLPSIIFPLFFFTAFAGGLSNVGNVPGFDFPAGYTAFQFVFVLLQSAAFGGVFTGFGIARDFEHGFARRLLVSAPHRSGIIAGYAIAAFLRWLLIAVVLTFVALVAGMQVGGNGIDLFGLYALGVLVNFAGVLWACGVAMRFRTTQSAPLMQTPVFMLLFLAPVYVPLDLLRGWIHGVAAVNPVTFLLAAGRSLLAGQPEDVATGTAIALALVAAFAVWALRGLRAAERAG